VKKPTKKPAARASKESPKKAQPKARAAAKSDHSRPEQGAIAAVLTSDAATARAVAAAIPGAAWVRTEAALLSEVTTGARIVLIDAGCDGANAYEVLRRLRPRSRGRFALLHSAGPKAEPAIQALARFAGAEAVLSLPPKAAELKKFAKPAATLESPDQLLAAREEKAASSEAFSQRVLSEVSHPHDPELLAAISDPETRLHSSSYGAFAFDLEFKRAQRFGMPFSIAVVGFEGEAKTETLLELAGIFLNEIRDTDTLARFSVNQFLFLLPNTLVEGARAMLERIAASVKKRGLRDVVGDPILLAGGVAGADTMGSESREQLYARVARAFEKARDGSLAAVVA